jgi:hypothetical protein
MPDDCGVDKMWLKTVGFWPAGRGQPRTGTPSLKPRRAGSEPPSALPDEP